MRRTASDARHRCPMDQLGRHACVESILALNETCSYTPLDRVKIAGADLLSSLNHVAVVVF